MTFINIETKKNIKQIEKPHQGSQIVTIKFVDWVREHPKWEDAIKNGRDLDLTAYEQAYLFVSISADGKVIVNDVTKVGPMLYADDTLLIDGKNWGNKKLNVVDAKFYDLKFP